MKSIFNRLSVGLATAVIVLAQVVMPVQAAFADDLKNSQPEGKQHSDSQSKDSEKKNEKKDDNRDKDNNRCDEENGDRNGSDDRQQDRGSRDNHGGDNHNNSCGSHGNHDDEDEDDDHGHHDHGDNKIKVTPENGTFTDACGSKFNVVLTPAVTPGIEYTQTQSGDTITVTANVTDATKYTLKNPNWSQKVTDHKAQCHIAQCQEGASTSSIISEKSEFSEWPTNGYEDSVGTGTANITVNGLELQTTDTSQKIAWYHFTDYNLSDIGMPSIDFTPSTVPQPGMQLVVDFGGSYNMLVGEPSTYGNNWWLTNGSSATAKANSPHNGGGNGSPWFGTLDEWLTAFPEAKVKAVGFSLGSGAVSTGILHSLTFGCQTWVFKKEAPKPAEPTASIKVKKCSTENMSDGRIRVNVTNTADETEQEVTYTVKLKDSEGNTVAKKFITLQDGESGKVKFNNVPAGTYFAVVTGEDGRVKTESVVVGTCQKDEVPMPVFTPKTCQNQVASLLVTYGEDYQFMLTPPGTTMISGQTYSLTDNGTYTVDGYKVRTESSKFSQDYVVTTANGCGGVTEIPTDPTPPAPIKPSLPAELPETGAGTNALMIALLASAAAYGAVYFAQPKRRYE